ncbi:MAG: ABC transporter substrate-binding protein [Mycetocola sp.]
MSRNSAKSHGRSIGLGVMAALGALALTACSGGAADPAASNSATGDQNTPLTPVTLTLNFLAGGPNSGFMVAKEKGYYADAGLEVTIQEGQGSNSTASLVAGGNSEFGFADGPSAMTVTSQDGDLINIGQILQTNGFSVMSLSDQGITDVADLEGKSVAVQPGTAQASLLAAVLAANDVDAGSVEMVNLDPSALVASLLQGSVDAISAGADNQGVQLRDQGADINEILYRDAGVPTIGLSMITQATWAEENPELVSAFVEASLRGWDDARNDPQAAAEIVAEQFPSGASIDAIVKQLEVDIDLLCAEDSEGLGKAPEANWETTFDLLVDYLDLPTTLAVTDYYTNDFLPAELPSC